MAAVEDAEWVAVDEDVEEVDGDAAVVDGDGAAKGAEAHAGCTWTPDLPPSARASIQYSIDVNPILDLLSPAQYQKE